MKITRRLLIFALILSLSISSFTFSSAALNEKANEINARKAAIIHIVSDIKVDKASFWNGNDIEISKAIELYDTSEELTGYLYNIYVDGENKGFIKIGNDLDEYPVMEWSYEGEQATLEQLNIAKKKIPKVKEIKNTKVIALFAGRYAFLFENTDNTKDIIGTNGIKLKKLYNLKKVHVKNEKTNDARLLWKKIDDGFFQKQGFGELGNDSDGITDVNPDEWEIGYDSVTLHYISSVPDKNQYEFGNGNYTGCVPTAASNIMAYFGIIDTNQDTTMWRLRYYMHTYQLPDGSGDTLGDDIEGGLINYATSVEPNSSPTVSIYGNWDNLTSVNWNDIKTPINSNKPTLLCFDDQEYYGGGHGVTLVGYKEYLYNGNSTGHRYMVIHDNWVSTPYTVYMAYGRDYAGLYEWVFNP